MEPGKKSTLKLVLIIFSSILFYTVLQNGELVGQWFSFIGRVLAPVFIGIVLSFIINIPLRLFEEKLIGPLSVKISGKRTSAVRPISLVLSVLVLIGVLTLVLCLIVPEVRDTAISIAQSLPSRAEAVISQMQEWVERLNLPFDETELFSKIDWNSISRNLLSGISGTGGAVIDFTSGLLGAIFNAVIGLALSLYILSSKEKLMCQAGRLICAIVSEKTSARIMSVIRMSGDIFMKFITGQLIEALLIGVACYIGMSLFRMPYSVMISALIAVTALIPVFGAFIGTAVGALLIFFVSPLKAIGFVIFIIIYQQIDNNVLYPRIVGSSVGLPGIWVLLAVTVGGGFFGAAGMLVGVPVCAVLYCLVREFVVKREGGESADDSFPSDGAAKRSEVEKTIRVGKKRGGKNKIRAKSNSDMSTDGSASEMTDGRTNAVCDDEKKANAGRSKSGREGPPGENT